MEIVLTFKNDGFPCNVDATGVGCPQVTIYDALGQIVWSTSAGINTGCAAQIEAPSELGDGWVQSYEYFWSQTNSCGITEGDCSAEQVLAGQYQVVGADNGGESEIPPSTPATISIAAAQ